MEVEDGAELCFPLLLNTSCKKTTSVSPVAVLFCHLDMRTCWFNDVFLSPSRQLHTPTNILLLSLAVSDFLVGLLLMPGEIFIRTSCWFPSELMCSLFTYVSLIITSASIGNMVLISVDRYVAICDPLHYTTRVTSRRVKLCVCLCWICSVFYSGLFVKDGLTQPVRHSSCYGECVIVMDHIVEVVDLVLTFIFPVTIIIILYMRVFVVAVSQARAMRSHITAVTLQRSASLTTKKSELKAARTLGVLVVVFLICFCPYYGVSLFLWCTGSFVR
uniref:G-protein coupled receptors family 1 profile domain-containing protein n=1 Tax=Lates calcarifer TaxID=8187 RepID=A0A4W6C6F5_LATCA